MIKAAMECEMHASTICDGRGTDGVWGLFSVNYSNLVVYSKLHMI